MMAREREPIKPRLMRSINERGGCWIWAGCKTRDGYGVLVVGRKQYRAHRVSFEAFIGDIPPKALVCHTCDEPLCINPKHLFLGTPKDNTQDMLRKGRHRVVRGSQHPHNKIPPKEYPTIRAMRRSGMKLATIAEKYDVSFQLISDICIRRRNYAARD